MTSLFKRKGAPLGQHFLTNRHIAEVIARESGAQEGAVVLEVGPGKGMLTAELLRLGAHVVAIEKDPDMVMVLHETFPREIESGSLRVVEGDARDFLTTKFSTLKLPRQYAVAANIPYYITGELIRLFLTAPVQPDTVVLLMQKEVAERIARSKKESLLSLSVRAYGEPQYIKTVKAGSFNPPPTVDSAILAVRHVSRDIFTDVSESAFFDLLHAGFGQKRKTLLGNLKRAYGESAEQVWEALGLSATIRAEDVPLRIWVEILKKLPT